MGLVKMGGGRLRYILGGWGWMNIFYGWVGEGGGIFWEDGGGRTFLWVGGGGWRYILGGWE